MTQSIKQHNTKIICITGKMASGKNTVSSIFEKHGYISIDADKVVHEAIKNLTSQITNAFLPIAKEKNINILNNDNSLNRKKLGELLFSDPVLLKKQEDIIYPYVIQKITEFINQNNNKNIIINATVLYKTPQLLDYAEKIIYVYTPSIIRFFRVLKRDSLKVSNIIKRFYSQKDLFKKYKQAKKEITILNNFTTRKNLENKIKKLIFL